jgi:Transposase DDE domain
MVSIGRWGAGVKRALEELLPAGLVEREARACGHRWRERKLGPAATVWLWVSQLLMFNCPSARARHLCGSGAGAVCQAKARLPLALLERLNRHVVGLLAGRGEAAGSRWRGHRVLGADGVCYHTPDAPALRERFGSRKPHGYPLLRALTLFELGGGAMLHQVALPHRRQEAPLLGRLLRHLSRGDVLVLDRAFASFGNFCLAAAAGVHLVARLRAPLVARRGTRRTVLRRLGPGDALVRWERPRERTPSTSLRRWLRLPPELTLRQVTVRVRRRGYRTRRVTVVTSLLDPARYPAAEVAKLYARRWEVETCFRHLKQTLGMDHLRCKSVAGVRKELLARALAYNLVRATMARAAALLGEEPSRVSFADTLSWLLLAAGADPRVTVNPRRPGRYEPRRVKARPTNYLPLNCPRAEARRKVA